VIQTQTIRKYYRGGNRVVRESTGTQNGGYNGGNRVVRESTGTQNGGYNGGVGGFLRRRAPT